MKYNNIKKIGVISDTHIPIRAEFIPTTVTKHFKDVDLIIHAGDIVIPYVLDELNKIAPVVAVKGNMDNFEGLPKKIIIEINNKLKIGITHGSTSPELIVDSVRNDFTDVNCIIFGHSHQAFNEIINNVLLFNPGSACDTVFTKINSIGILHINEKIKGEIIKI